MSNVLSKWKNKVDMAALNKDAADVAANGGGDFKEVPAGKYEVMVEKMEIKETKKGDNLMISTWLKIKEGDNKGQLIFLNHCFTSGGLGLHQSLEFLRSLETEVNIVDHNDIEQFGQMVDDVFNEAENLEYVIGYTIDKNGFGKVKVEEVFEK